MATKPTIADSAWATDANFSSGDASGTPTKVNPTGIKSQGWRPGDALGFVAAWANYIYNQFYLWCVYLNDLHNSAEFLNKSYTWLTGMHRFTGGMRSAGIGLESGDLNYTDTAGAASARSRNKHVGLELFTGSSQGAAQWSRGASAGIYAVGTAGSFATLDLPQGAILQSVNVWATDGGGAATISLYVYKVSRNRASGATALGSALDGGAKTTSGAGTLEFLTADTLAETVDNAAYTYEVFISSTTTSGTPSVSEVYVTFDDFGFKGNG